MPTRPEEPSLRRILIVGGGTAGWLTAGVLASRFPRRGEHGLSVTLVESRTQPPIGVGEGTWPTMRATLQQIGVSETDFLRECDASFKQGTQFSGWVDGGDTDDYYHPFTLPAGYQDHNLAPYWQEAARLPADTFADSLCFQTLLCKRALAPKQITTPEYAGLANYAYHLDAGKFVPFLQRHCVDKLGVEHVFDEIVAVQSHESGDIAGLTMKSGARMSADLYVDCTGFAALLLGKHLGVPFRSTRDVLFADHAWAVQVPYVGDDTPIASITKSTALAAGWVWDIGLTSRRGVGYVYSANHTSDEAALDELKDYLQRHGGLPPQASFRKIPITAGYREEYWRRNCVAVGLSAGFLEPLEASAIVMIELSAKAIANLLPGTRDGMAHAASVFNAMFRYRWERIVEFLKLHYLLSARSDSSFWIENRRADSVPGALRDKLEYWAHHSPWHDDFTQREEVFSAASYQYILYGMGFATRTAAALQNDKGRELAQAKMQETAQHAHALAAALPGNRELLAKVRRYGFQRV